VEYYIKPGMHDRVLMRETLQREAAQCEMAALGMPLTATPRNYAPSASPDPYANTQMALQGLQNSMAGLGDAALDGLRQRRMFQVCLRALGWTRVDGPTRSTP
jgi:hypothetical protein